MNLYDNLRELYLEIEPLKFYRDIFGYGNLDKKNKFNKNKYVGIACEFFDKKKSNGQQLVKRYSITDDLDIIKELLKSENFIILSPISYIGKSRISKNARLMHAFTIEIDGFKVDEYGNQVGFKDLVHQFGSGFLPKPNYIVASGNGLHLYYIFDKPLFLYPNVVKSLIAYKNYMTPNFWNGYVTELYKDEDIQYESVFQGFRLAGGVTKKGERTKIFKVKEEKTTVAELNSYIKYARVRDKYLIVDNYSSKLSLEKAKELYPNWYEKRIVKGLSKNKWIVKKDLYNWWLREIKDKKRVGHRYYNVMLLCIYAIKCGVSREALEKDCFSLLEDFDSISESETNRFTIKDVSDALQAFEDKDLVTFPINSIKKLSGIDIKKNKRNYQKQEYHLEEARAIRDIRQKRKGTKWTDNNGRPKGSGTKEYIVLEWRKNNPIGKKIDCHKDTKLSRVTIDKYWNLYK